MTSFRLKETAFSFQNDHVTNNQALAIRLESPCAYRNGAIMLSAQLSSVCLFHFVRTLPRLNSRQRAVVRRGAGGGCVLSRN